MSDTLEILKILFMCIGLPLAIVVALIIGLCHWEKASKEANPTRYHYVSVDGEEGDAANCSSYRTAMCCEFADGGKILVKEYHKN